MSDAIDDEPGATVARMRKVLRQEPGADDGPAERGLRRLLEAEPDYYREALRRLNREAREGREARRAERLRLLAESDQLRAKIAEKEAEIAEQEATIAELERRRLAGKILAGLRELGMQLGCCPVCRSQLPAAAAAAG